VSDPLLDELAEAARNRGLKLVRSRVRTPTKRRFGKAGLADKAGRPVFGMDSKGPVARPEDVEDYLRNLGANDWGASLDGAAPRRKRKAAATPAPKPKPKALPEPKIREAKPSDSPRLVELIHELGHEIDEKSVRRNIGKLRKTGELPLVATLGKDVVAVIGRHAMVTVHRPNPVGRIPMLVVASEARGRNIGRMLVEAVENWCRKQGCAIIEVTSNDRRTDAHAFYRHLGYERTSLRFMKQL
jgi:GNAT superfamily N-acetyltransferase